MKLSLKTILIGVFCLVAMVSVVVSWTNYVAFLGLNSNFLEIAQTRRPALYGLSLMDHAQVALKGALRMLLIPGASEERYQTATKRLSEYVDEIEKGFVLCDALPKTDDESRAWQELVAAYRSWKSDLMGLWEKSRKLAELPEASRAALRGELMPVVMGSFHAKGSQLEKQLQRQIELQNDASTKVLEAGKRAAVQATVVVVLGGLIAVAISLSVGLNLGNYLSNRIKKATADLGELTPQITSASREVASTSQEVANGASQQAASLQETSASVEELSSMSKSASDRTVKVSEEADKAAKLSQEGLDSIKTMDQVVAHMQSGGKEMEQAIAEILGANASIAAIIKTVDEIAFQTNILSLNAAVEAARAGEAGAGFAVVADEVRNLAQRSSKAARETATLIENATNKSQTGSSIIQSLSERIAEIIKANQLVRERFEQIAGQVQQVEEHVQELKQTANEQMAGQEQIAKATNELDKVTQKNAASAEELSAASQQMLEIAGHLPGIAEVLTEIVQGKAAQKVKNG